VTAQAQIQEIDLDPLVATLVEKTKAGKIKWEPTANDKTFISSVGGETTFKLKLESFEELDFSGYPQNLERPVLSLLDAKGHEIWQVSSSKIPGGLWSLYKIAKQVANRVDEKVATLMETLEKL
jgi:hypothetical protein